MKTTKLNFRYCQRENDESLIRQFLLQHRDEFASFGPQEIESVIDIVFERGGFVGGFDREDQMQLLHGYLIGDPAHDFKDQHVVLLYITLISKAYRLSRAFMDGLVMTISEMERLNLERFRLQALVENRYANRLYAKISNPVGEGVTRLGHPVVIYEATIAEFREKFNQKLLAKYAIG